MAPDSLDLIDYPALLAAGPTGPLESVVAYLRETLPFEWLDAYVRCHPGTPNVLRIENGPVEYLFDFASDPSLGDQRNGSNCFLRRFIP